MDVDQLKPTHDALRATLQRATREPGRTGEAARQVAGVADGHFLREEKFVLPLLALLPALARGDGSGRTPEAPIRAQALREQLPQMLDEHRRIRLALRELAAAAEDEGHGEYVAFVQEMILHADTEERVLYPAAIVAGEYVGLLAR